MSEDNVIHDTSMSDETFDFSVEVKALLNSLPDPKDILDIVVVYVDKDEEIVVQSNINTRQTVNLLGNGIYEIGALTSVD